MTFHKENFNYNGNANPFYNQGPGTNKSPESFFQMMSELNEFMKNFIDQSPPPCVVGLQREFRERSLAEKIFGTVFGMQKESKCILYPSENSWICDHGFISVTFLGIELDLLLHDILTYNFFDLVFNSTATSVLLTYLVHTLRVVVRDKWGKLNVSGKALVDYRFLN